MLHRDVVLCVSQGPLPVSCLWLFCCGGSTQKDSRLPNPKRWTLRSRRTSHLDRPPGRSCREGPEHFGPTLLAFLGVQHKRWVVNPRTRDSTSLNASAAGESTPRAILRLLHQTPAGESTPAGDLEAVPLNASGRVDPSGWFWNFNTMRSQWVSP